jgi:hypothetical protein
MLVTYTKSVWVPNKDVKRLLFNRILHTQKRLETVNTENELSKNIVIRPSTRVQVVVFTVVDILFRT